MLNKVVLPYTIWYTGLEKILRLNLDKKIDAVTNISTKATLNGTSVNDLVSAIFNPKTKSIDITIRSDARMDVDGEMKISLSYSDAKTHESILVVSVRSHENTATETPEEVKQTKLTLLNGQSHTVGAADEQVVYSFDLVDRNVTDEFATYGDVKDMLIGLGVTDSGEKDQYTILLEGDNLVLSKENDPSYRKVINLAKYHDEVSGEPLNVEDLKRDILSIVDGKIPNVETLKADILSEADTRDTQLKVSILHEVYDVLPNAETIKNLVITDIDPRIPDKDTLKTEILESAGEKDAALKTAILEEVGTRTTQNNQSLKQEIMGEVDGKLPNTAVLKEDILGEVDTKITINNQTFKSTVMSEVDSKIPDVSVVKSEILNEVNPRLLDKETLKQEILSAVPTPANYTLAMEEDNLVLGKEGDASYRKVINLAKYHDVNAETIKQNILDEVNPKLIDKDSFKNEVLAAVPTHALTSDEILNTLNSELEIPKFTTLAMNIALGLTDRLVFHKTDNSYKISYDPDGPNGDASAIESPILTIPFSSLRELPTATQAEPVTLEKIFELLNDDSKANVLNMIKNKLDIPEPTHPVKLISEPSVTNGVLKFNTENQSPTVDFTNDFYTKSKVDALLSNAAPSGPIEGHGRPDKKAELENAKIGTTYVDLDKTDGASIWMKKSKWVVIEGDTGDITLNRGMFDEDVKIRRINNTVIITPSVTAESNIKRDIFTINLDVTSENINTIAMMHIDKLGFTPLVTSTHESTWYFTSAESTMENPILDEKMVTQLHTNKYLSFSCRFEFLKGIDNGFNIKFIPDYGVFFDLNNIDFDYKVNLPFVNYINIAHRLFTYETHDVWPELSN